MGEDILFSKDHEWIREEGNRLYTVGVTEYAVDSLGDITMVELIVDLGTGVKAHQHVGDIESVKAVAELYSPVDGNIVEFNEELEEAPELVNESPMNDGWLVRVLDVSQESLDELMTQAEYDEYVAGLD